jgi:23S rRNA (uracil1939-C5)-methyltransferase
MTASGDKMAAPRQGSNAVPTVLDIVAVGSQGDGRGPAGEIVPLSLPGERVRARLERERSELLEVLQASPERAEPPCPHFGDCGGCALQHWQTAPYLAWKAGQIARALSFVGLSTEILAPFAAPPHTRRRLALHARPGRGGALLGFKARRSWRLVDIHTCPIADPALVAALPALRTLAGAFLEHPKSAPTLHVTLTETGIDIDVTGVERRSGGLSADRRLQAAQAAGEADFARVTLAGEILYQARSPMVRVGPARVALPPGGFLQAVAEAETAMAAAVVEAAAGAERIADLFCGVGTFSFRLAAIAPVLAADADAAAIGALRAALATAPGLKPITAEVRDLVRRPVLAEELRRIDTVVFDPPRAGAAEQTAQIARSDVRRVIGVSCNPVTFARDARTLADAGFVLNTVLPVDQFVWSPHIELVGTFSRDRR